MGLGKTDAPEGRLRKSMSSERIFTATGDEAKLYEKLANISETLSTEMQKEGLYGRTLTLKLKTASFEVRSRAVTLPKFICSSEDILNHASKLLKAELPLSLRLMGLRMSHFSDCEVGHANPLQKTLKNFVITGDASTKAMSSNTSMRTDMGGNQLMFDTEVDHRIDGGEKISISGSDYTYDENSLNSNSLHHLELDYQRDGAASDKDTHPTLRNDCLSEVDITQSREDGGVGALSAVQAECKDLNGKNIEESLMENPTVLLPIQEEQFYWVDDYKCSLCGYELPQSFIEERQEHSDYHFAEMLQKEESHQTTRNVLQRSGQKPSGSGETKSKKRKMSAKDSKYIPIDLFFSKTNHNF